MNLIISKIAWIIFGILSISIGLYPILYFVFGREFGVFNSHGQEELASFLWNSNFYAHIIFGGIALAIGWIQFNQKLRDRKRKLHKKIGMAYVTAVFFSSLSGIFVAVYTAGGWIASLGFICLGLIWFCTTMMGWITAKTKDFDSHEEWMIYSYAACFAAVTLRIYLPLLQNIFGDFIPAYQLVAWLCWLPNMVVAYFITNKKRKLKMVN